MTDARVAILSSLSAAQPGAEFAPLATPVDRAFNHEAELPRHFAAALEAVHGECIAVGDDWPRILFNRLLSAGSQWLWYHPNGLLGAELRGNWPAAEKQTLANTAAPVLRAFDQPIEICREDLFAPYSAGFTAALGGIAETGSVILASAPTQPRALSLVPEVHCVLLDQRTIAPTLEDWMARYPAERVEPPTNLIIVTGPSKSADIEQTLTLGVHGPKQLLVFLRS